MAHIYSLEMQTQDWRPPIIPEELLEVEARYTLNAYVKAVLGIRPKFTKLDNISFMLGL